MIELEKLSELKNASRFGTCFVCGADSNDNKSLVRIKFDGVSVVLCTHHMVELHDKVTDCINWMEDDER